MHGVKCEAALDAALDAMLDTRLGGARPLLHVIWSLRFQVSFEGVVSSFSHDCEVWLTM